MKKQDWDNSLRVVCIALLTIVSLSALAAGYSFITDPTGHGVGISTDYLKPTAPFKNFLVPGIVLFIVNGVFSSIVAVLAIKKQPDYGKLISLQGTLLVGWITVQLMMVTSFHPLHLVILLIGIILSVAGLILSGHQQFGL